MRSEQKKTKIQDFQSLKMDKIPATAKQVWAKIRNFPDFLSI